MNDVRSDELAANLAEVRARIASAERDAGRSPGSVTLVVVTKTWPASDVRLLARLGVTDVGENRDQEAGPKHDACADLGLRWHFIGQLQRNKARSVASYADVVQSVDRAEIVTALDRGAAAARRVLEALVQVDLGLGDGISSPGGGTHRGGAAPVDVGQIADLVAAAPGLRLSGVMAVAPLGAEPRAAFERLAGIVAGLQRDHPEAVVVSAGMSHDLEAAVLSGATHVRVGTAVLGGRPALG